MSLACINRCIYLLPANPGHLGSETHFWFGCYRTPGFSTHKAFGAAIRSVEAGRRAAPAPDFDADQLIARLHELGEDMGSRDQALRLFLGVTSDGPRSGPPA